MRILLTGASGFIGQHLLQALLAEGHHVVCAQRRPAPGSEPRLSTLHADFVHDTDKSTWLARLYRPALAGVRQPGRQRACSAPWPACPSRCASAARPSWCSRTMSTTWWRPSSAC